VSNKVQLACSDEVLQVPLNRLLPTRALSKSIRSSPKFLCIQASIRELELIEPLVVFPQKGSDGMYIVLDGHIRLAILKELGFQSAKCLISTDDEGFTFNHKVNRLSAIQEHFMIAKAIKNGASEERIARTLNVDLTLIRQKRDLLVGICSEAVHLLRDKRTSAAAIRELRKVLAIRQIEIAELMVAANNFTIGYMKCLVGATPREQRAESFRGFEADTMKPEDIAKIEHESQVLVRDLKAIEESHGKNVLNLVIVTGYLRKLLENARVVRFLSSNYLEIFHEFQRIVEVGAIHTEAVPATD
jgi:hypothetical protein